MVVARDDTGLATHAAARALIVLVHALEIREASSALDGVYASPARELRDHVSPLAPAASGVMPRDAAGGGLLGLWGAPVSSWQPNTLHAH